MPREVNESFAVEHGFLVRRVIPRRGRPYEHRCPLQAFTAVAHGIEETRGAPFVADDLRRREDLPWTQVTVAVAFLKDRGLLEAVHGRRHVAAEGYTFEDAMIEYYLLAKGAP